MAGGGAGGGADDDDDDDKGDKPQPPPTPQEGLPPVPRLVPQPNLINGQADHHPPYEVVVRIIMLFKIYYLTNGKYFEVI